MKFKTVAEAFNFYNTKTVAEMETRAAEIKKIIDSDPQADVASFNIELEGIRQAKENVETRSRQVQQTNALNLVTGQQAGQTAKTFEKDTVAGTPEYRSAFYKTLLGRKLTEAEQSAYKTAQADAEKRADVFNASTDNVAVIPTSTLNEVVKKARTIGGLLAEVRAFAMPTKIAIPVGTPANKAAWHTEGAEVEGEKLTTSSVIFEGNEIIKVFSLSAKTRTMSIDAFESYLTDELTDCVMETIEDSLVNGTGEGQGKGLVNGITWNTANTVTAAKSGITYADVVKVLANTKRGYSNGAKWAMNNATLYNVFYGMVDANKRPIFIADPQGDEVGKILGHSVVIDDNIADNDIYFGNFAKYLAYNMPEGIAIEVSRDSSFRKGLIDYRALAIADTQVIVPEAFTKLTVQATA